MTRPEQSILKSEPVYRIAKVKVGGIALVNYCTEELPSIEELFEISEGLQTFLNAVTQHEVDNHNCYAKKKVHEEWVRRNEGFPGTTDKVKESRKKTRGYVYFIKELHSNTIKIGRTVDVRGRSRQFGVILPFEWYYIKIVESNDHVALEEALHQVLSDRRVNGEWFDITEEQIETALIEADMSFKDVTSEWVKE